MNLNSVKSIFFAVLFVALIILIIVIYKVKAGKDEEVGKILTIEEHSVLPFELDLKDDLENKGCALAEDEGNKLLQELTDSNARNLEEHKVPTGTKKGKYYSCIMVK